MYISRSVPLKPLPRLRAEARQRLPPELVRAVRQVRARRAAMLLEESWALARIAQVPKGSVPARDALELSAILNAADPGLWALVSRRITDAGHGHNSGGINPGDRRALAALVAHLQPERVLEVGTHVGSSTLTLAATLEGTGARITTVDISDVNDPTVRPWERYGVPHSPADTVRGLAPVEFVVNSSVSHLAASPEPYDFIFLDGDHSAATVYQELPLALSRLRPQGVVLMHDYFPRGRRLWKDGELIVGPFLGVRRLLREGWPIQVVPLGELPWPTKLGSNRTSLALVLAR